MENVNVGFILQVVAIAFGATTTLIAGLAKRSFSELDTKLSGIAADVKEIREETGEHAQQLARGDERMNNIEDRIAELKMQLTEHLRDDRAMRS
jgi:chromosome segregation ATPase